MVALAALENGVDPRTYLCLQRRLDFGSARVSLRQAPRPLRTCRGAIATSCDVYFYQTALALSGPTGSPRRAPQFGLGADLRYRHSRRRRPGLVPTPPTRGASPKDPVWHPGETPVMGIGQGYTHLNPLQLCVQAARLANGKKALNPRLIRSVGGVQQPSGAGGGRPVRRSRAHQFVREAMAAVTTGGDRRGLWRSRPWRNIRRWPARPARPQALSPTSGGRRQLHGAVANGSCATTPGSSPSRRPTIRATR